MSSEFRVPGTRARWRVLLSLAALVPFGPGTLEFLRRGIPDLLFTGDGAALELGVLHASRGLQLVGPYSRFGWSHPGPMYFYLALPFYEALGQRGPALNVFAFAVDAIAAVGIVLTADRLRGPVFGFAVAALMGVYALVALPFLNGNEWNPILPILPLVLLSLLAARIALGAAGEIPLFAFVSSFIVQTHVGFAPEVVALWLVAFVLGGKRLAGGMTRQQRTRIGTVTLAILAVCWVLPLYEAATSHPGNLELLIRFFVPKNWAEHSWRVAAATVADQIVSVPLALLRTIYIPLDARWPLVPTVAIIQMAVLVGAVAAGRRRGDAMLQTLAAVGLVETAVAVVAVRAIRGDIQSYLVVWATVPGLLSIVVATAWLISKSESDPPTETFVSAGILVIGLAVLALSINEPVTRGPVFRDPDPAAELLADGVETFLRADPVPRPLIRVATDDAWPTAAAVILQLYKDRVPVAVEERWVTVVGKPLAANGTEQGEIIVGDRRFNAQARDRDELKLIASAGGFFAYVK